MIPDYHKSRCKKCKGKSKTNDYNWDWIEHIYCISLKDREDRTRKAEIEFHKVGLCDKVMFYRPKKDRSDFKRPGTRGCWNSHHTLAKKVLKESGKMVLLFEDDVQFDEKKITPKNISKLAFFTKKLRNWNILYLGQWSFFSLPTRFIKLHRVFSLTTHAYILSNNALKWLSERPYEKGIWFHKNKKSVGLGLDVFFVFTPRSYAYFPMMAYQRGAKTSNQRPHTIGSLLINWGLSDPKYMRYNQYIVLIVSLALISVVFYSISKNILL